MKINLICSDNSWIYGKFVTKFGLYSRHKIFLNGTEKCDLIHCIPYYDCKSKPVELQTSWLSHQELANPLKDRFISAAKQCDWCITPALKYVELLKQNGITNVSKVNHGVDLGLFKPLQSISHNSKKLSVGWVGRSYSSTRRKNENLLKKIATLDFVDLKITGGKIKEEDMPRFYSGCSLMISPSLAEGGPMSITEGLACGIPSLCYSGVGVADEFESGVLRVAYNDEKAFIDRLKEFWKNREDMEFGRPETMQKLRSQVEAHTWENFVAEHDKIWENIK